MLKAKKDVMSSLTFSGSSNFTRGEILKTGAFFVDDDMNIEIISALPDEFEPLCMNSIIHALKWFRENVLVNKTDGYYLRRKLAAGVTFDEELNRYFINSHRYWLNYLNERRSKENKRFGGKKFIPSFRPVSSNKYIDTDLMYAETTSKPVDFL